MNSDASALPGSTSVGVRCPAICSRSAISLLSIVFNTAPASPTTSTCSIVALPLEKLVIRSSYTRCVFPSDPANATGASRTSSSTGVIVSVATCCRGTSPQASTSTQICPKRIVIVPRLFHRLSFTDNPHLLLPLPSPSSSVGFSLRHNSHAASTANTWLRRDIVLSSAVAVAFSAVVPACPEERRAFLKPPFANSHAHLLPS